MALHPDAFKMGLQAAAAAANLPHMPPLQPPQWRPQQRARDPWAKAASDSVGRERLFLYQQQRGLAPPPPVAEGESDGEESEITVEEEAFAGGAAPAPAPHLPTWDEGLR